jgi:hypothetical protein
MEPAKIKTALADITAEKDATVKALKLASLCSTIFSERGIHLVVVGGSAIEFLTEGAYASGDVDLCIGAGHLPHVRERQDLMSQLGAEGGLGAGASPDYSWIFSVRLKLPPAFPAVNWLRPMALLNWLRRKNYS